MTKFWLEDLNNLLKFNDNKINTNVDLLNFISRYSIVTIMIFIIFRMNSNWFYIPVGLLISCIIIYYFIKTDDYQTANIQTINSDNKYLDTNKNNISNIDLVNNCTLPTFDNPYMNVMYTKEYPNIPACNYENHKEEIDKYYRYNIYSRHSDIFKQADTERQFYTMPITTVPNRQNDAAEWLHKKLTCKSDGVGCLSYTDLIYNN